MSAEIKKYQLSFSTSMLPLLRCVPIRRKILICIFKLHILLFQATQKHAGCNCTVVIQNMCPLTSFHLPNPMPVLISRLLKLLWVQLSAFSHRIWKFGCMLRSSRHFYFKICKYDQVALVVLFYSNQQRASCIFRANNKPEGNKINEIFYPFAF